MSFLAQHIILLCAVRSAITATAELLVIPLYQLSATS